MANLIKTLALTAPLIYPNSDLGAAFSRIKYCTRGLVSARISKEWFDFLHQPELAIVARHRPEIYGKLQRPYLNRKLNAQQRLETLKQHYRFVSAHFSKVQMEDVYAKSGLQLAAIPIEEVGSYAVKLCYGRHEKEGDFLISLINLDSKQALFELSCCVAKFAAPGSEIFIGGLQGNRVANDKESIVAITRGMYGLRPKALLFFVLQQLAACWGINRLRAISDDTHIYQHAHKRKDLAFSYDEFWLECGGVLGTDGMFDLPVTFTPREISTLKANKRQMYRRRHVFLAEIAAQISQQISPPGRTPNIGVFSLTPAQMPATAGVI